jgi:tetratricopeptide (TPR) repeat protein
VKICDQFSYLSFQKLLLLGFIFFIKFTLLGTEISLSEKILGQILDRQERFFANYSFKRLNEKEMTRHAQEIVANYESYLSQNPEDENALVLFGKFLRKVGQEEHAVEFFMEADKINPKLAVVKQQLANYLIEKDRPVDAFPFLILTIELSPKEAIYHFQLGNFLFLFEKELVGEKIFTTTSAQSFMHQCFREANKLEPTNFDFHLRYAQSFFDFTDSNKSNALKEWKNVEKKFPSRTKIEKDYFRLCQVKVLLELNRSKDASLLLKTVSSKSLKKAKDSLLMQFNEYKQKEDPRLEFKDKKQSSLNWNHKRYIPTDPHLERLRKLTGKLIEEKMLSELKADAIKARYDQSGEIKIELTNLPK